MDNNNKFNFFVPATFSKAGEKGVMKISGICSSNTEDSDGEFLDPTGFDFQPLLEKGYFNWNHQANKSADAILGRPTSAEVINGGKDFHVEGYLYKGSPQAKAVYDLAKILEEEDPTRRLGFSIEGQALERDPLNKKKVRRARITGIAITHCPKNSNTLLSIMKGEYSEPFIENTTDSDLIAETCPKCDHDQLIKGTCLECGYSEKAMSVNIDINPESVEGKPKSQVDSDKVNFLTKSQIYNKIFDIYTDEIEKAKQIYNLVEQTAIKLYNMKSNEITGDVLSKAFEILDSSISIVKSDVQSEEEQVIIKSEEGETKKEEEEEEEVKEEVEEVKKEDVVEKSSEAAVPSEMEKSLVSIIESSLQKSEAGMINILTNLAEGIDKKFGAISEIMKSQIESSTIGSEKVEEFQKSLEEVKETLEKIGNEPFPKKSVTDIKAIERFQKSLAGETKGMAYELSKAEDRKAIGNHLLTKAQELNMLGQKNPVIDQAIADLEITKSLSEGAVTILHQMGVQVVN